MLFNPYCVINYEAVQLCRIKYDDTSYTIPAQTVSILSFVKVYLLYRRVFWLCISHLNI